MCNNDIAATTSLVYMIVAISLPVLIFIIGLFATRGKKMAGKLFLIVLVIFIIFMAVKLIFSLNIGAFDCMDCYVNNNCSEILDKDKTTKKTTTTSTTVTTSTTSTTTTKKVNTGTKDYDKVAEISGTKVDKGSTSKGYSIYEIDGITYVDGYLIANKTYHLPEDFVPTDTYKKADGSSTKQCGNCINNTAYDAWKDMDADATALGLNLYISSGFRSYLTQSNIYNRNVSNDGKENADTYSARPGSSEHQTGLAFDLNTINDAFSKTDEGKWVDKNCYKYGFIIRYPQGKTDETGYIYESWHLRYVGTELATILYNDGDWITMEDYFGITSKYAD